MFYNNLGLCFVLFLSLQTQVYADHANIKLRGHHLLFKQFPVRSPSSELHDSKYSVNAKPAPIVSPQTKPSVQKAIIDTSKSATRDTLRETRLNLDSNNSCRKNLIKLESIAIKASSRAYATNHVQELNQLQIAESKGKLLAESLAQLAGVSTISMGNNIVKPVINGLHSNRIIILNNGIRQEGQQWGVEHAPEIDPFSADKLQVVKGAEGVRYGADALGGIVLISANDIDTTQSLYGVVNLVAMSNGRGYALNTKLSGNVDHISRLGWSIQVSSKQSGNYKTSNYYLGNTGSEELNFSGALQYHRAKSRFNLYLSSFGTQIGIFEGAHVSSIEDIYARINRGYPFEEYDFSYKINAPKQKVSHQLAKASWHKQLTIDKSMELVYGLQRNHRREFDLRRVASDNTPMADMKLSSQSLDYIMKSRQYSYGVQALMQVNNNMPGTGTTPIIPNYDSYSAGLFGLHHFYFNKHKLELGARYDIKHLDVAGYRYDRDKMRQNGQTSTYLLKETHLFQSFSGTVGIHSPLSKTIEWKSNIGLAWRPPTVNELYSDGIHHGSATYEIGNPKLKNEKGMKWMNTFILSSEKTKITLDLYGQLVFNYIYAQPDPVNVQQTIRGTFPLFTYQQHDALLYGVDIQLSQHIADQLQYQVQGSIIRAKNIEKHSYLPYIPADQAQQSIIWHPLASSDASYIKLTHRYVSRQTRYEEGADYAAPPLAYSLIDLNIGTAIKLKGQQHFNFIVSLDNFLNTTYKDYMDRFRYFSHQRGRNIQIRTSYHF